MSEKFNYSLIFSVSCCTSLAFLTASSIRFIWLVASIFTVKVANPELCCRSTIKHEKNSELEKLKEELPCNEILNW